VCVFVSLPPRGYIIRTFRSSLFTWDLLLSPSERVSSSLPTHVCVSQPHVLTSSGHFDLFYFDTLRSHTSVLSATPTSAHAVTVTFLDMPPKKGCHWQSILCRYKDRLPKDNSTRDHGHTRIPNESFCCLQGKGNSTRDRGLTRVLMETGCCL
jgi:hypothetical protein